MEEKYYGNKKLFFKCHCIQYVLIHCYSNTTGKNVHMGPFYSIAQQE